MSELFLIRNINDKDSEGNEYNFVVPDLIKLMNTQIKKNDNVFIPMTYKNDVVVFWESGGRKQNTVSSIATIVTGPNDQLLDAILFNKIDKKPNGKQALLEIKPGYNIYVGKISMQHNTLAPRIRIVQLEYKGISKEHSTDDVKYGEFIIVEIFNGYKTIKGCFPGERLVEKLFSANAMRPFFVNGWSISNISKIKNRDLLVKNYTYLAGLEPKEVVPFENANQFLDKVENDIIILNNKKLSAVFQLIDFEKGTVSLKPIVGIELSNINNTIENATAANEYVISIDNMLQCYNPNILFSSTDTEMLEMALVYDDKYAIQVDQRKFLVMRGFRG